ncbi:MAG: Sporulation initiation inhibitor protein Soj [Acidimicrobiales bacterium]|nr:MAG: ParA family protein [Actinomycetota bacterium]MBV6509049.1 Sporulation initiation inhibitor protein Soj [Acidimicrobiales bacterium]RIK06242.1 MAG: cobyrinic acid a,c-diamide synthase [Acidobacteriota bacterium]
MRILATYSIKGGVGKTSAAVNLAYFAARSGERTLVWDLDPQGAATYCFRIKQKVKGGAKAIVRRRRELDELIKGTDYRDLDLVPADFSYRYMDLLLDSVKRPTSRLRKVLKPLGDEYDYVFLDCPPSISLVSENVIAAADALLVPLIPTTLSVRTLDQLDAVVAGVNTGGVAIAPFFSMVDRRRNLHCEIVSSLPEERPEILSTQIPYSSSVEQMSVRRAPLGDYSVRSRASEAFRSLWEEIKGRVAWPS